MSKRVSKECLQKMAQLRFVVRAPRGLMREIDKIARSEGLSRNQFVLSLFRDRLYLEERGQVDAGEGES